MEFIIDKYIKLFNLQPECTINARIAQTANTKRNAAKLKATELSGSSNPCVLFMCSYLTSCGYYCHLHGSVFRLPKNNQFSAKSKIFVLFSTKNTGTHKKSESRIFIMLFFYSALYLLCADRHLISCDLFSAEYLNTLLFFKDPAVIIVIVTAAPRLNADKSCALSCRSP